MQYFLVGKIVNTHGIRGELKVINESNLDRFKVDAHLYVKFDKVYKPIIINSVRYHQKFVLITINNLNDINLVSDYVGKDIYIKGHNDKLQDGKHYYDEIIGSNVYNQHKVYIGLVNDIIELPNGLLLEIKQSSGKISLVPYVKEFVKSVDSETKTIFIQEIEGLL